jgi:tRNA A-37 threonylcarbamoyl transferase component Bud32
MPKLIAQGAESKIYLDKGTVIKDRFPKRYRLKQLDEKLRKSRTKREAKVLEELNKTSFPVPKLIFNNEKNSIKIGYIKGKLVKNILEKSDYLKLSEEIGMKTALLHNKNIIHGDLTTSNMILNKEIYFKDAGKSKISGISKKNKIFFIDFGLSFFSNKVEDKAVDLHLLKQALESKHYKIWKKCFSAILKNYKKHAKNSDDILNRLDIVENRGRYKGKK